MKKLWYITFIISITSIACSKKSNPSPGTTGTVSIAGSTYNTVVIGNQSWTVQNYAGPGGTPNPRSDFDAMGKFYLLTEVKALTLPAGWRVPTEADFMNLLNSQGKVTNNGNGSISVDSVGASHLRATNYWGIPGDNSSGFNALPVGDYNSYVNIFPNFNAYATFWSSTPGTNQVDTPSQCTLIISGYRTSTGTGRMPVDGAYINEIGSAKVQGYSLRFVKDN